jgi:hypothetical protein
MPSINPGLDSHTPIADQDRDRGDGRQWCVWWCVLAGVVRRASGLDSGVRFLTLATSGDSVATWRPASPDDRAALMRWRDHGLAIAAYLERNNLDAHLRGVQ